LTCVHCAVIEQVGGRLSQVEVEIVVRSGADALGAQGAIGVLLQLAGKQMGRRAGGGVAALDALNGAAVTRTPWRISVSTRRVVDPAELRELKCSIRWDSRMIAATPPMAIQVGMPAIVCTAS